MTAPRTIEHVLAQDLFTRPPVSGDYYTSPTGGSVIAISRVRAVSGLRSPGYRLIGVRVRTRDLPPGVTVLPWPRKVVRAQVAAPIGPPPPVPPIVSQSARATAERKRVVQHQRQNRDPDRQVEQVRINSGSAVPAEWRDPDDISPNRRVARTIRGYRGRDQIAILLENASISKSQAWAAKRFRKLHELGELGLKASPNLLEAKSGFEAGGGPSESRLMWLESYQAACRAMRSRMLAVVMAIIIRDQTLRDYAEHRRIGRGVAAGLLIASLEFLVDYFKELDDIRRAEQEAHPAEQAVV